MPETSRENNERPLSGCREAMRTAKSASCRWRTMRRPRNPVPPDTVTRRQDMSRRYPAAPSEAIIFSAFPEAKPVSASRSRSRRVTSIDEFQACARPSFASGTDGSNPAPSSKESRANLKATSTFQCRVVHPRCSAPGPTDVVIKRKSPRVSSGRTSRSSKMMSRQGQPYPEWQSRSAPSPRSRGPAFARFGRCRSVSRRAPTHWLTVPQLCCRQARWRRTMTLLRIELLISRAGRRGGCGHSSVDSQISSSGIDDRRSQVRRRLAAGGGRIRTVGPGNARSPRSKAAETSADRSAPRAANGSYEKLTSATAFCNFLCRYPCTPGNHHRGRSVGQRAKMAGHLLRDSIRERPNIA